jgi:predicted Co/Zn/Cd cation transporter (cation efflux family)
MVDAFRREVSDRLDAASPDIWLTIDFTADRRWI